MANVLWPQREDLYALMLLRATIGEHAFNSEKQSIPINPELCEWPAEYFSDRIWFDEWPQGLQVKVMALDPSKGTDAKRGDYSAYVMLGVDRHLNLWLDADLKRRDTEAMVADGIRLYQQFQPDLFAVEENSFQHLLAPLFQSAAKAAGVVLPLVTVTNTVPKPVRIRRWTPYLAQNRVKCKSRSPGAALLVKQGQEFPVGDHDDGWDAAEMALRKAIELWNKE